MNVQDYSDSSDEEFFLDLEENIVLLALLAWMPSNVTERKFKWGNKRPQIPVPVSMQNPWTKLPATPHMLPKLQPRCPQPLWQPPRFQLPLAQPYSVDMAVPLQTSHSLSETTITMAYQLQQQTATQPKQNPNVKALSNR